AASPQHGAQQQAGLGVDHTVDRADAAQHVVEGGQVGAGDLGDQVPAAVGGVQGLDLGEAAQVHDHAVGAAALDLDEGGRTHGRGLGVVAHPHREAHDHAGGGELVDPAGDRGPGDPEPVGEGRDRGAAVVAQGGEQSFVEVGEALHAQNANTACTERTGA